MSDAAFLGWMTAIQQEMETTLDALLPSADHEPRALNQAMRYATLGGGKRVRALLTYAAGELGQAPAGALARAAAAVEMIHAYSLVHDDLPCMDDDVLRRGKATCHVAFDEATALLAGDALQTQAFAVLAAPELGVEPARQLDMLRLLAHASGPLGMAGGQAIDLASVGKELTRAELEVMHLHKTGALIRAAVRMGALSAGERGRAALPALDRYAENIGLAFQVQDDILDVVGDTATLGKRQGADQQLGKSTYPALLGLEQARKKAHDLIADARRSLDELAAQSLDTSALEALANYIIQRDK